MREESSAQMVSSQDSAVAAALRALDIPFKTAVKISDVTKGGPADGKLKSGDQVLVRERPQGHQPRAAHRA